MTLETLRLERRECFDPAALPLGMVPLYEDGEWLGLVECQVDSRYPLYPKEGGRFFHVGGEWYFYQDGTGLAPVDAASYRNPTRIDGVGDMFWVRQLNPNLLAARSMNPELVQERPGHAFGNISGPYTQEEAETTSIKHGGKIYTDGELAAELRHHYYYLTGQTVEIPGCVRCAELGLRFFADTVRQGLVMCHLCAKQYDETGL